MRRNGALLMEFCMVGASLLTLTILLQHLAGAYQAEFDNDNASHYISGLMIHDYFFMNSAHLSAIEFLKYFYVHYPLVGIGHWPPGYYIVEATWFYLFSTGRTAVLTLSAFITAATATVFYSFMTFRVRRLTAFLMASALVVSPIFQEGSDALMLDIPVALLCLLGLIVYKRYLDGRSAWYSVVFGAVAAAALMVKGNAGCLALVPPIALLIAGRFDFVRRPSFWLPVPIVMAIAGPWYIFTYGRVAAGFDYQWGLNFTEMALRGNFEAFDLAFGPLISSLGLVGLIWSILKARKPRSDNGAVVAASLLLAVIMFQSIVPAAILPRYMAPALPPLLILAARGGEIIWGSIAGYFSVRFSSVTAMTALKGGAWLLVAASFMPRVVEGDHKPHYGIAEAARHIWSFRTASNPSVLVASDSLGEGASIVELAMSDPSRPSLYAIRAVRMLGKGNYAARDYSPKFSSASEVMAAIDHFGIPLVLIYERNGVGQWTHFYELQQARKLFPDRWQLLYRYETKLGRAFIYRITGNENSTVNPSKLLELQGPHVLEKW